MKKAILCLSLAVILGAGTNSFSNGSDNGASVNKEGNASSGITRLADPGGGGYSPTSADPGGGGY